MSPQIRYASSYVNSKTPEQREHKCMYENLFAYLCRLLKEALEKATAQHTSPADGLKAAKLEGEIM